MPSSPPITVEEVRKLREAAAHPRIEWTAAATCDDTSASPMWWEVIILGRTDRMMADARAALAQAAPSLCDLVLEQAAEIERMRAVVEAARDWCSVSNAWGRGDVGPSEYDAAEDYLHETVSALDTKEPR